MEQFHDGRSIPPGYAVPGGKDEKKGRKKMVKNWKKLWKIEDFSGKKGIGTMDNNDKKWGKMKENVDKLEILIEHCEK